MSTIEIHTPETELMVEMIHIIPEDEQELHSLYQCVCDPHYGTNENGIKTATHRERAR